MRDEEKEINKYREQGTKDKKKHQIVAEAEKYELEEEKMIGSPDMLSSSEKKSFIINALARKSGMMGLLTVLILPLGSLLVMGAANIIYDKYMLGDIFTGMLNNFYRPFMYTSLIIIVIWLLISLIIMSFVYVDKKRIMIRANDKLTSEGKEPFIIPHKESDKDRVIAAFYKVKPPYIIFKVIPVIALAFLVFAGVNVFTAAGKQQVATDKSRDEARARMEKAFSDYDFDKKHEIMRFVDRHTYNVGDHVQMIIDIDENGKVLDASYMINLSASYSYKDLEKMSSKDVEKEMQEIYAKTKEFKDLFVYPEVTEVPVKFSDYMNNYIDNIREKSSWKKDYEYESGEHTYITHCEVSYSEGKKKSKDDDRLKIVYDVQQKDFERTQW